MSNDLKTHWKKLHNPDYLGAWDFQPNEQRCATIKTVLFEKVKGSDGKQDDCAVCHFAENIKPMILNVTNSKMIEKLYETPYIEDWKGKKICIRVTKIKAFGEFVDALRVVDKLPELEELTPNHSNWNKAKQAIASGNYSVAQVKTKFKLSPENEKLLCLK